MNVSQAVLERHSTRAFLAKQVEKEVIEEILEVARRSPSGSNVQPWKVYVTTGDDREIFLKKIQQSFVDNPFGEGDSYQLYPNPMPEPYNGRRKEVAKHMFEILGISYEDKDRRLMQVAKNFEFFGAPVGLFFTIHKLMGFPQWAHLGMFIQTVMLLAQERGLATCPQEAWYNRHKSIKEHFEIPNDETLYCGLALGYEDTDDKINSLVTTRMTTKEFTQYRGFD